MQKKCLIGIPDRESQKKLWKIMKLTIVLLIGFLITASATNTYSQKTRLDINLSNISIKGVLGYIEQNSEFVFLYRSEDFNTSKKVDIDLKDASINQILDEALKGEKVVYDVYERQIVIRKDNELPITSQQQKKEISGNVKDSKGLSLPGVSVVVKGTTLGTTTDADGQFRLSVPVDAKTLVFSFVGMKSKEVTITEKATVYSVLEEEIVGLGEYVAVGYGVQKKLNLTGSISTVNSGDLVKAPVANISQTLAGRLPGLIAKQTSGEPGYDYAELSIRGFGTALVIVDGVESLMNNLDPNEIESVSILKDASAAIYGARAGNGVILITTKRGRLSKPSFEVNGTYSLQSLTAFPKTCNVGDYVELFREAQVNAGTPEAGLRYSAQDVQNWKAGKNGAYRSPKSWWDASMNNYSPMQNYNFAMSGGSEKIKFHTFGGYTGQTGMYKSGDNQLKRYNISANLDANISENLTGGFDLSLINSNLNSPVSSQPEVWKNFYEMVPTFPASLPDPNKVPYGGGIVNVLGSTTRKIGGYSDKFENQVGAIFNLKYSVPGIKGLSIKGLMNYLYLTTENKTWQKKYLMWTYDQSANSYTPYENVQVTSLGQSFSRYRKLTGQVFVNYDRVFDEKHNLSVLMGTELADEKSSWISAGRGRYITESIDYLFAGGADSQTSNGGASETGRLSYVGRINYNYKSKYFAETTMRYDGSPKFPADKRWGFFPSVSAAWRISEEPFLKKNADWLDNLKLRTSYSKTGYDAIGAFQYLTGFSFAERYLVNNEVRNGLVSTGLANPNITWENLTTYNVGLDFSVFRGKLYGEFDGFYRERSKMLASRILSLPNTFGATLPLENINSMNNRGFELMVGHRHEIGDFMYDVSANISWSRAKWQHYEEPTYTDPDDIRIRKQSGNWADRTFGYQTNGLFTSQTEINSQKLDQDQQSNATIKPGDVKYIDQNNDGVLDWKDLVKIGRGSTPEVMFGLNANLKYKKFDLSVLIQGATLCDVMVIPDLMGSDRNVPQVVYDLRWTEENNNKWAKIPRLYMGFKTNNQRGSDYWLKDGSYVRLKSLNIGYNFSPSFLKKITFSSMRVYLSGTNLLTFSGLAKFDMDPESVSQNGWNYPQQKVFALGLNLKF